MTADTLEARREQLLYGVDRIARFCRQTAADSILPSLAWFSETADMLERLAALVRPGGVPQPQTPEIKCRHCGEDIRLMDGEWLDRETHSVCGESTQRHEPLDQSEDGTLVGQLTAIVREADAAFQRVGGSSRHWVRDCFLPLLNQRGWSMARPGGVETPPALSEDDRAELLRTVKWIKEFAEAHHAAEPSGRHLHSLTIDIPHYLDYVIATLTNEARGAVEPPAQEPPMMTAARGALRDVMDELREVGRILKAKPEQSVIDAATEVMLALDMSEALRSARSTPPPERPQEPKA